MIATKPYKVNDNCLLLTVSGILRYGDGTSAFRNATAPFFGKYRNIICDFSRVKQIEGTAVGALIANYGEGQKWGSKLDIINYNDAVAELPQLVKMLTVFAQNG